MFQFRLKYGIKSALIVCVLCLTGTLLPVPASYAQSDKQPNANLSNAPEQIDLAGGAEARDLFQRAKKYHDGDGVQQDLGKAFRLYLKAASMGDNDARINLGYMYFMGQGVKQSYTKAKNWYLGAANNGDTVAQEILANMYERGLGVDKDPKQAEYWRSFSDVKQMPALEIQPNPPQKKQDKIATENIKQKLNIRPAVNPKRAVEADPSLRKPTIETGISVAVKPVLPVAAISVTPVSDKPKVLLGEKKTTLRNVINLRVFSSRDKTTMPVWVSTSLVGVLLGLALLSGVWFVTQYSQLRQKKKAYVFAKAFYVHHRDQLRVNYLRYPAQGRGHKNIDDMWVSAMCTLMVKFAQKQKEKRDLVGEQSRVIMRALSVSTLKARQAVFPFVGVTQQQIFADIEAHDCKPEKPPQFLKVKTKTGRISKTAQTKPKSLPQADAKPQATPQVKSNVVKLPPARRGETSDLSPDSL